MYQELLNLKKMGEVFSHNCFILAQIYFKAVINNFLYHIWLYRGQTTYTFLSSMYQPRCESQNKNNNYGEEMVNSILLPSLCPVVFNIKRMVTNYFFVFLV